MKLSTSKRRGYEIASGGLAIVLAVLLGALPAAAVPVQGQFANDPTHCDNIPDILLTHELGNAAVFPIDEQLFISVTQSPVLVCVPDDGLPNEYEIRIINVGSIYWQDLFFVADEDVNFALGNWDGFVQDLANPGPTPAFRIDAAGSNNNLLLETIAADGILEPGEAWVFHVTNFGSPTTPVFDSVAQFSFSSAPSPPSSASILANPVPEPATMALLGLGGLAVLRKRRRKQEQ